MKKPIVLSMIIAVMALGGSIFSPSLAQSPAKDDAPTFYHLVPGTFVNGWPRFTVTYPKGWGEHLHRQEQAFYAVAPGSAPYPAFGVVVGSFPLTLDKVADLHLTVARTVATDVTLVSDKPSRLRDGAPARETGPLNGKGRFDCPCAGIFARSHRGRSQGHPLLPRVPARFRCTGEGAS